MTLHDVWLALEWRLARIGRRVPILGRSARGAELAFRRLIHLRVEIGGIRILVSARLSPVIQRALWRGSYKRRELRALEGRLDPSDTVLELGTGLEPMRLAQ